MKKIVLFLVSLFFSFGLFAGEKFQISISPEMGMLYGNIEEYVLMKNITEDWYTLSRLDWDLKSLFYVGLKNENVLFSRFYVGLKGKYGFPAFTGRMIDNDWRNYEYFPEYAYQTDYSEHDCYINHYYSGKVSLGYQFQKENVSITPLVSLLYRDFFYTGMHGWGQYGYSKYFNGPIYPYNDEDENHFRIEDYESRQRVITYHQIQYISYVGIKINCNLNERVGFSFLSEISPYAWAAANDHHYSKDEEIGIDIYREYYRDYLDILHGTGTLDLSLSLFFNLNKKNQIGIEGACFVTPMLTGKSAVRKIEDKKYYFPDYEEKPNSCYGGSSSTIFSLGVNYSLKF